MNGKGRESTYNFFSRRLGGTGEGHRAQGAAGPLPPGWRRPCLQGSKLTIVKDKLCAVRKEHLGEGKRMVQQIKGG